MISKCLSSASFCLLLPALLVLVACGWAAAAAALLRARRAGVAHSGCALGWLGGGGAGSRPTIMLIVPS